MGIIWSFIILGALGILLGIGLAFADKKFSVEKDEKLEALEASMPGANCGGCGFAGCSAYAEAVFKGTAKPGLCSPGGQALADRMGEILGVEVSVSEKRVAHVFCSGNCSNTTKDYDYKGLDDCNAASLLFRGDNTCKFGCLHLGSCIKVCPQHCISRDENGTISVDSSKCIGCGKCESVCPNGVIKLVPASYCFAVDCNSHDNGAKVRKACEAGCIGCRICETKFPESGFKVTDFLASYGGDGDVQEAEKALEACPRKIIHKIRTI